MAISRNLLASLRTIHRTVLTQDRTSRHEILCGHFSYSSFRLSPVCTQRLLDSNGKRRSGHLQSPILKLNVAYVNNSSTKIVTVPSPIESILRRRLHPKALPYVRLMRLDKPTGVMLLLWPCYWSIAAATEAGCPPDPYLLTLFGLGAILMRGAGCTVNDYFDREFDAKVARTATRPIASKQITGKQALVFLAAQSSLAAIILFSFDIYRFVEFSTCLTCLNEFFL